jgi:protein-glutamine gamma-glutamyltransferase
VETAQPGDAATRAGHEATAGDHPHRAPARRDRLAFSLRVLGGTLGAQWERDRRDTLFLMAAMVLAVLPQLQHLPAWCGIGFFVLFVWRLGLVMSGRPLPPSAVRWIATAACIGAVYAQYRTLLGREPGVALLVLFLGLKLMEMRAHRDLFVVIFLCFFVLLTGFFHSQSPLSAALGLLAVLALVAAMLTMQFGHSEVTIRRRFRTAGALVAQALPVAALLFLLFPRLAAPLWGLPDDAHGGRTGISETMSPGQISDLAQSDEVAFRVRFDGDAPAAADRYWRGPTLGSFDGTTWRAVAAAGRPAPEAMVVTAAAAIGYELTLEPHKGRWLFALEVPASAPAGIAAIIGPDHEVLARAAVTTRVRYRAAAHPAALIGLNETPDTLRPWLALPRGANPLTHALAAQWRADEPDDGKLVARALDMFRQDPFTYTLTPPLLAHHGIDTFLFQTRSGFCEHFASAFVVLMRALGIPARVVTGYQGAEATPSGDYWIVRQSDAHAWAEVWLPGQGWRRVDPTAAVAPERIEHGSRMLLEGNRSGLGGLASSSLVRRWWFSLDSATHAWNQWVLSYDSRRQQALLARLGLQWADPVELIGALAALLALLTALAALVTLRPKVPRDPLDRCWDEFCQRLAAIGAPREVHETASRYLHRVDRLLEPEHAALARDIVTGYNRLRYDPDSASPQRLRDLRRLVTAFRP